MAEVREVVETGVDELIKYLKFHEATNINDIAKALNTTPKIIESWADFLIEENIVGIEYKFTTPYLYLIENETNKELSKVRKKIYAESKENLNVKEYNWKNYMLELVEGHKNLFIREAKKRRLENPEALWEEYKARVVNL